MPSVSPSDGGYTHYKKSLEQIEEDLKAQSKRAREQQAESETFSEKRLEENLRKQSESLEATVNNIRNRSAETHERDRAVQAEELAQVKAHLYNRYGKMAAEARDSEVGELKTKIEGMDAEIQAERGRRRQAENDGDARAERAAELGQKKTTEAVTKQREATQGSREEQRKAEAGMLQEMTRALRDRYQQLNQGMMDETDFHRKQTVADSEKLKLDFDHQAEKLRQGNDERADFQAERYQKDLQEESRKLRHSHTDETRVLRDQLQNLSQANRFYNRDKNEATSQAIKEFENEWRARERLANDSYQRSLEDLKLQLKEQDSYLSRISNEALREKDRVFSELIGKQNSEHHHAQNELQQTFERNKGELDLRNKLDRDQAGKRLSEQLQKSELSKDEALKNQAQAFNEQLKTQKGLATEQVSLLQKQLGYISSGDPKAGSLVPAAIEERVRNQVLGELKKTVDADQERNRRQVEGIQKEYTTRYFDAVDDSQRKLSEQNRVSAADRQSERSTYQHLIHEMQEDHAIRLNDQGNQSEREIQRLSQAHAQSQDRLRKDYEELLSNSRIDAQVRLNEQRQEADFNFKMAQRAFATRQNELVREYEKRIADQKAEFDAWATETKATAEQEVRATERKSRQALEEQARSYEQRIAQLEQQHSERERAVERTYRDELERTRRSNAILKSKKG